LFLEDIEAWIDSLSEDARLQVFQALSEYLSVSELKAVMSEVGKSRDLLAIHRQMGLIRKYQVDLLRIHRLRIL
jgi:hypothetical protein